MNKSKEYTLQDLQKNNGRDGNPLWILMGGNIYDVTNFDHPGGREVHERNSTTDKAEAFKKCGSHAYADPTQYLIGKLKK